jgi:integrase
MQQSKPPFGKSGRVKVVRRTLADGTVKEYRYKRPPKAAAQPRIEPASLDAMLDAWQASPEWRALAENTRTNYIIYLRGLTTLGRFPATSIKRRSIISLRNAIAETRGNGAASGFVRATSAAFAWGMDNDWAEQNPAARLKPLARGTLPAWTEEVLAAAFDRLAEPYRRAILLAVHTGQRRGDLIALPWSAYDGQRIRLTQEKTRTPLVLPVHRELKAALDAWRAEWEAGDRQRLTILASPRGLPWTAQHFSRDMGRAVKTLGMGRFTPHGLRKLCAVRLAEAGCSAHQIAAICGWRSLSMVAHYTRAADQEGMAGAAIVRLENARKTAKSAG